MNRLGPATRWRWRGLALGTLAVLSFLLCIAGFLTLDEGRDLLDWRSWSNALYQSIRIWTFEYDGPTAAKDVPITLHIGRLGAIVSLLWVSWIGALLLLRERTTPLRLWLQPADIVFCGIVADSLRIAAAQKRCSPGLRMALVAQDPQAGLVQLFRQDVSRLVVLGDAAVAENLAAARVHRVRRCIYVAGETDARTIEIVAVLLQVLQTGSARRSRALQVVALLSDRNLLAALPESLRRIERERVELSWVDPAAVAARVMLERLAPDGLVAAAGRPIHVLILGSSRWCEALILQLVRNVYPRPQLTRITVVAADAEVFRRRLFERFPALAQDFADRDLFDGIFPLAELQFIPAPPANWSYGELQACEAAAPLSCAFVHLDNDDASLLATHRLQQLLTRAARPLPIAAYFQTARSVAGAIAVIADRDVFRCRPSETYLGEFLDQAAMLHQYAYDSGNRIPAPNAPAAEHATALARAEQQWRATPEWQRDSSRHVADHIHVKLRHIGFGDLADGRPIDPATASRLRAAMDERLQDLERLEHRRFCAERMLAGWLPIDLRQWNGAAAGQLDPQDLQRHRDRLKSLRLNATLTASVELQERDKDRRLVSSTAWILYMAARRGAAPAPAD